jgi:hypothetical protein
MRELLTSTSDLAKASLATRIFISRLRIEVRAQPTQLAAKMDELKAFIAKNAFALSDLATV